MTQKDQLSESPELIRVTPKYLPQETLQYKTFLKRTIQEALQNAFALYKDKTLSKVKVSVDYQTSRANFPNVVIKFFERNLKNVGVGHKEYGPTNELERLIAKPVDVRKSLRQIQKIASTNPLIAGETRVKGKAIAKGTFITNIIDNHSVSLSQEPVEEILGTEVTFEGTTAVTVLEYHHYMYEGDIALEIYGVSSADRDKVVDAIVEIVGMGIVGPEGRSFQERLYETIGASEYPFSKWHFIAVNTDLLNDYGEQHMLAPWMAEDTWLYKNEQRFPLLGEFYNVQPLGKEGYLKFLEEVDLHPWNEREPTDVIASGRTNEAGKPSNPVHLKPPSEYPHEEVPLEDTIPITKVSLPTNPSTRIEFQPTLSFKAGVPLIKVALVKGSLSFKGSVVPAKVVPLKAGLSFSGTVNH